MSPSGVGIKVKSKISKGKSDETESKSYSDNIEAKRQAASEALKAEQKKREEQLKKAAAQKKDKFAEKSVKKDPTDVKDDLSKAAKDYIQEKDQESDSFDSHQFEKPVEFIRREIEVPESIQVGELAKLMHVKGGEVLTVLLGLGVTATINDLLDQETAILAVDEIGHTGIAKESEDIEEDLLKNIEYTCEKSSRNPVVTARVMLTMGKQPCWIT